MVTLETKKSKTKNINKQQSHIIILMDNGIEDDYEHLDESIDYVLESVLMEDDDNKSNSNQEFLQLNDLYNSRLIESCVCLVVDGEPNCNNINNCSHGGNYTYQENGKELILNTLENDEHRRPIIECDDICSCQRDCMNRLVQHGPRKHLEIFESPLYKSLGLRTIKSIPKGAFICEYAGELLTQQEALRRTQLNDKQNNMNYVLCLNEYTRDDNSRIEGNTTIVDPSRRGNIGRYINHSCDPNCEVQAVRVTCPIPKICIFAKRDIKAWEELSFHYGRDDSLSTNLTSLGKPCLCGALNCSKYLPNIKI